MCYEIFKLNNFKLIKQSFFNKGIGQKGKLSSIQKLLKDNLEKKIFLNLQKKEAQ